MNGFTTFQPSSSSETPTTANPFSVYLRWKSENHGISSYIHDTTWPRNRVKLPCRGSSSSELCCPNRLSVQTAAQASAHSGVAGLLRPWPGQLPRRCRPQEVASRYGLDGAEPM